ncbi:glutathione binding-like protein [Roseibium sediminicola]|uniref:Glutathione binding-like protein n=1 Tax=Roseibium sediminicola TaxID=2933272 RepID=A0ABT0GMW4_9HYPH|nr:glutathione binding-like protein [Roseibium sp. CAU 1639]MCK7610761.1 glutathione binding-like protein [Roseibium sp. CAU 1639]
MKLFYKPGACSMAAHLLLNEAGAEYSLEKVDTSAGLTETGARFAETNPRGYVPALQFENGDILTENVAILHWLGEHYPGFSSDKAGLPIDRFRLLELLSFLSSELHKAFSPYFSGKDFSDAEKAELQGKLDAKLTQFDAFLQKGGDYLFGDTFSVADAYAFVILNWTNFIGVSLDAWPKTKAYLARIGARPAAQKTLTEEGLAA